MTSVTDPLTVCLLSAAKYGDSLVQTRGKNEKRWEGKKKSQVKPDRKPGLKSEKKKKQREKEKETSKQCQVEKTINEEKERKLAARPVKGSSNPETYTSFKFPGRFLFTLNRITGTADSRLRNAY